MYMMSTNELKDTYNSDGSDLRRLQLRMLDILIEIDRICKKHKIPYWLSSGTLLGAVRHNGFIPWDDDLDIEMLREDYLRLIAILPYELPENLRLQYDATDPAYVYQYAKVRDLNSYIKETCVINQRLKYQGAFVDIFPMEKSSNILSVIAAKLFNRLCFNQAIKHEKITFTYVCCRYVLNKVIFPIFRIISKCIRSTNIHHTYGVNFLTPRCEDDIFPLTTIPFENYRFSAPCCYDKYLEKIYGDYMKIPDVINFHRIDDSLKIW